MNQGLQGIAVGDPVIVTDLNREKPVHDTVAVVGRKYATIGGRKYDLSTGHVVDGMGHRHAYTPTQWARRAAEARLSTARVGVYQADRADHLSDADVTALAEQLEGILAKLRGAP